MKTWSLRFSGKMFSVDNNGYRIINVVNIWSVFAYVSAITIGFLTFTYLNQYAGIGMMLFFSFQLFRESIYKFTTIDFFSQEMIQYKQIIGFKFSMKKFTLASLKLKFHAVEREGDITPNLYYELYPDTSESDFLLQIHRKQNAEKLANFFREEGLEVEVNLEAPKDHNK